MSRLLLLSACLALPAVGCPSAPEDPPPPDAPDAFVEVPFPIDERPLTGFVDPMIGTRGSGNALPGALVPHGMVRLSPDTLNDPGAVESYEWGSDRIEGFTHTNWEGPGGGFNGTSQLLVLPQTGERVVHRSQRASAYAHDDEVARPGYYAVTLLDSDVRAELTATQLAGVHRYSFPAGPARLLLDLGHSLGLSVHAALRMEGSTWTGQATYNIHPIASVLTPEGETAQTTLYFHGELSAAPQSTGTFRGQGNGIEALPGRDAVSGPWTGGWAEWDLDAPQSIELRMGISLISVDQARANLAAQVGDRTFDEVAAEAEARWNTALNRVQADGDVPTLTKLYTALYRSFFQPADHTESNGQYVVGASGAPVVRSTRDGHRYFTEDWCMWDTFRTSHPLRTLIEPELTDDITTSMLAHYEEGGWLPKCTWNATGYSRVMIGNHAIPIIVDAYLKGLDRIDADLAWEAIDNAGTNELPDLPDGGCGYVNLGTPPDYIALGYVPTECDPTQSVSMTLEHAYDDWVTARFAQALGRETDAARYDARAAYWRNHWNPEVAFMQARDRAGDWVLPFDPTDSSDNNDFAEADSWIYSWFVPHDVPGLIEAMGGAASFVGRLDAFFDDGHFEPSNQPSFHVPWLYAAAGDPAGTQARVRAIVETEYGIDPGGLPGNDDAGSTSAFLALSMLGIYPIAPGDGIWTLTAPRVASSIVHLHPGYYDGGAVEIVVVGDPTNEPYVQSATWNGAPLTEARIAHATLVAGGTLEFVLGAAPSDWGR